MVVFRGGLNGLDGVHRFDNLLDFQALGRATEEESMQTNSLKKSIIVSLRFSVAIVALTALSGCGDNFSPLSFKQEVDVSDLEESSDSPDGGFGKAPAAVGQAPAKVANFCSPLSFQGVKWDSSLSGWARRSMSIGLSLSGSFEGGQGWKNLTNNFDGQGLSAGLLNQTLGTSSLQPLLAQLLKNSPEVFTASFGSSHRASIVGMVSSWQRATGYQPPTVKVVQGKAIVEGGGGLEDGADVTSSVLDRPEVGGGGKVFGEMQVSPYAAKATPASSSVDWAVANLYDSKGSFVPSWKSELRTMLGHPDYVSIQIRAAQKLHEKALKYVSRVKINDVRTYLLMFDIAVQNGGINESEFVEWEKVVKSKGLTQPATKLKALIDIRVRRVLTEWQKDVRSRKYAIIDGTGTVHGSARKLNTEYCYSNLDPIQ